MADMEYKAEMFSRCFRKMYDVPEDVPVFDRAKFYKYGCNDEEKRYWVHVVGMPEGWVREVEKDQGIVFPTGFNNIVDVVDSVKYGKMVYVNFRMNAPNLPMDF